MLGGGFRFALPALRNYKAKEIRKRNADRRVQPTSAPFPLFPLPLAGEGWEGAQRVCSGTRSPIGVPPRLLPSGLSALGRNSRPGFHGTWQDVRSCKLAPTGEQRTSRSYAGVTRARLSQSRERTSRTGRSAGQHDAQSCPGAECIGPRAGTALAPLSGVPSAEGVLH